MSEASDEVRLARVALGWLVEPGNLGLWRRVAQFGPVRVLDGLLAHGLKARDDEPESRLRQAVAARLDGADPRARAERALARGRRLGARVVTPEDDEWPTQLDRLISICVPQAKDPIDEDAAPPLCLWVRGQWRLDEALERSVAVVGARAATDYGAQVARQVGYGLAEREWGVVSGGAFGIDAYAHRGALAGGGITVAVLACGVDRAYPAGNAGLFERIAEVGLVVSEWPPGAEPFRHRFLIRNRVIAAGSAGTVVVEASARSGARQTLRRAGELGKPRMVVPGPVTSAMSVGCHEELRNPEVMLVTGVPHILEEVGSIGADLAPVPRGPQTAHDQLGPTERRLVEALLKRKPLAPEQVAARAGVPIRDALRMLPGLAYRGFARQEAAGYLASLAPDPASPDPAGAGAGAAA